MTREALCRIVVIEAGAKEGERSLCAVECICTNKKGELDRKCYTIGE